MLRALRRRTFLRAATAIGLAFLLRTPVAAEDEADASNPAIPILRGLDRASRLYLDAALHFACEEKIVEDGPTTKKVYTFDYMYVYDENSGYEDYRTRGGKSAKPVNPRSLGVHQFLQRGSMWVLIFNHTRFASHRYRLAGSETMHGVAAVKVEFEPLPPYAEGNNDWFGTAWVDLNSYQLLHVEAMKVADHRRLEEVKTLRAGSPHPSDWITDVVTDFEVVKNGMRFPSRVTLTSSRYLSGGGPVRKLFQASTVQSYSDYRFYGVRTTEEIRDMLGISPPPTIPR